MLIWRVAKWLDYFLMNECGNMKAPCVKKSYDEKVLLRLSKFETQIQSGLNKFGIDLKKN